MTMYAMMTFARMLCALLPAEAEEAAEVREVEVGALPWSVTKYLKGLGMEDAPPDREDVTLRLHYGEQVMELRNFNITSKGNGALWLGNEMVRVYDDHDDGVLYMDDRWAEAQLEDVNGDGAADLTVYARELRTVDEQDEDLPEPVVLGSTLRVFLHDAAQGGPVEAGWRFVSRAEGGQAVFPHRLEIQRAGEAPTAVWRSLKPMAFLGYVDAGEYAVVFFADPLISPSGNIILAWRLVAGKAPELIYTTPYSESVSIQYRLSGLHAKDGLVRGSISARLDEGEEAVQLPALPVQLSAESPCISARGLYSTP